MFCLPEGTPGTLPLDWAGEFNPNRFIGRTNDGKPDPFSLSVKWETSE